MDAELSRTNLLEDLYWTQLLMGLKSEWWLPRWTQIERLRMKFVNQPRQLPRMPSFLEFVEEAVCPDRVIGFADVKK